MPYLNEFVPVIIDPSHERFGHSGLLFMDNSPYDDNGDLTILFADGKISKVNNGLKTGLSQYYVFPSGQSSEAGHLISVLPDIKNRLAELFSRANNKAPTEHIAETKCAQAAATYLIAATLYPEMFTNAALGFPTPNELDASF